MAKKPEHRDLFPCALEIMILQSLRLKPMHGYALVKHIKEVSDNLLQVEEGSLYPALQRMLREGWLESETGVSAKGRPTRIYRLTDAGVRHLEQKVVSFEKMFSRITRVLAVATAEEVTMKVLSRLLSRRRRYDDLSVSIQEHIQERTEELIAEGMPPNLAGQTARREFGNVALIQERSREVWRWQALESILADLKLTFRRLRKSPCTARFQDHTNSETAPASEGSNFCQ
jgi:PadR family transcriptional regulator PadR